MTINSGLSYEQLIDKIRHEMIYGAGCKGPRSKLDRPTSTDTVSSDNSFLSADNMSEISDQLANSRNIHQVRHCGTDRDIFIAFKGRSETGEIAYGACIHRRGDPYSRLSDDEIKNHWVTALKRLDRHPVPLQLDEINMEFASQLKRCAYHREDITQFIVDNLFDRLDGRIRVRSY